LVYQDHLTNENDKRADEVAYVLLVILTTFEAPSILQSDNTDNNNSGFKFTEICVMWPKLKIVHGEPRYPQSQGYLSNELTRTIEISLLLG
jgi:hypothetical protein